MSDQIKTVKFFIDEDPVTGEYIDDQEVTLDLPASFEVCGCCRGTGTTYLGWHSSEQPAFTQEDFDYEGPDFMEDYMTGRYDKTCPECNGRTTTLEIDWDNLDEKDPMIKAYMNHLEQEDYHDAEREAERRMGC
ncbi:MAG: hypothetical protein KUG81_07395 [Gammaproteobacteria bacterium]|nr:hypothetical protein [Gammaproteobacteria bacterium]